MADNNWWLGQVCSTFIISHVLLTMAYRVGPITQAHWPGPGDVTLRDEGSDLTVTLWGLRGLVPGAWHNVCIPTLPDILAGLSFPVIFSLNSRLSLSTTFLVCGISKGWHCLERNQKETTLFPSPRSGSDLTVPISMMILSAVIAGKCHFTSVILDHLLNSVIRAPVPPLWRALSRRL